MRNELEVLTTDLSDLSDLPTSAPPLLPLAGARGRGMRVVTAQLQLSTRTGPQSHATTVGAIRSHPLPSGGSREENPTVWRRVATCLTCPTSHQAQLPFSRWREKGQGDEGGDRATPSATTPYAALAIAHSSASPLLPLAAILFGTRFGRSGIR